METLNCKNEIVNRSLSLLREKEIIDVSIEPSSDTEKLIHKWFETAKAECIMEIEPTFAIKRLKLNVEKVVNAETLEEIKNTKNKEIEFKDWMKSVVENDINELQNEIEKLENKRSEIDDELLDELNREEQNTEQIKYLQKRIKHINLNIIIIKERIRFLEIEYNISCNSNFSKDDNLLDGGLLRSARNDEMTGLADGGEEEIPEEPKEETPTPPISIPTTPLIPAKPTELLEHIIRRRKVIFFKELKRQDQIRRYEEYEAWKLYCDKNRNQQTNYLYGYRIPTDCLKIFDKNFELLEGNYIYSYLDNGLTIKYLSNSVELYSREIKFNIALSYLLAYYICADLQNNDDKIQLFFKLKNNKISEARTNNLREIGVSIVKNYRWKK